MELPGSYLVHLLSQAILCRERSLPETVLATTKSYGINFLGRQSGTAGLPSLMKCLTATCTGSSLLHWPLSHLDALQHQRNYTACCTAERNKRTIPPPLRPFGRAPSTAAVRTPRLACRCSMGNDTLPKATCSTPVLSDLHQQTIRQP